MSTASHFAEFLQQIGHQVRPVGDLFAYDKQPSAWLAFPFHKSLHYGPEIESLLASNKRILLLRYCETDNGPGIGGHRIICQDQHYSLSSLHSKARNQTRRGLENCTVEQISPKSLRESGFELFSSTRNRQHRPLSSNAQKKWQRYCDAAERVTGFSAWGAWSNGHLSSLLIGFRMGGCFNILRQASRSQDLSLYPNNALIFTATQELLSQPEITEVSYGLSPIGKPVFNLDSFKRGMGYIPILTKQNVVLTHRITPIAPAATRLLGRLHNFAPNNELLSQAHAMLSIATQHSLK